MNETLDFLEGMLFSSVLYVYILGTHLVTYSLYARHFSTPVSVFFLANGM